MNSKDVIFEIDLEAAHILFHQSGPWAELLNLKKERSYAYESVLNAFVTVCVDRDFRDAVLSAASPENLRAASLNNRQLISEDFLALDADGSNYRWYHLNIVMPTGGKSYGVIQDIQRDKDAERRLRHRADYDSLTDLLNRTAFEHRVSEICADSGAGAAFLIIDFDDFKQINDLHGHIHGDLVLARIARLMSMRCGKDAVVGRFGGDEFIICAPALNDRDAALKFANELREDCAAALRDESATISIGISFYPEDGHDMSTLMSAADAALYHIKNTGKNACAVYEDSMPRPKAPKKRAAIRRGRSQSTAASFKQLVVTGVAVLLAVAVLVGLTSAYVSELNSMIEDESREYLSEIAYQINISAANTLSAHASLISSVEDIVESAPEGTTLDEVCAMLDRQSDALGYERIELVDAEGFWHSSDGARRRMELLDYAAAAVEKDGVLMTDAININGVDHIFFFAPLEPTTVEGVELYAVAGFVPLDEINRLLRLRAFNGLGFADIVSQNGAVIVRSTSPDAIVHGYNLFAEYEAAVFLGSDSLEKLKSDLHEGLDGVCRYTFNGREYISYYTKLAAHDWTLFCTVPVSALQGRSRAFMNTTVYACAAVALIIVALMGSLMLIQDKNKRRLEHLAYVDAVTGGSTRDKLYMDMRALLASSAEKTVIYADIQKFKLVNDRFGKHAGDALLSYVSHVFEDSLQAGECGGRLNSDRFAVMLNTRDMLEVQRRIAVWDAQLHDYPHAVENMYSVNMAYGAYAVENGDEACDLLIDRANLACATVKNASGDGARLAVYNSEIGEALRFDQRLEDRMELALVNNEFEVHFQPQYSTATGELIGFEALARWLLAGKELLYPGSFIDLFERNGFIVKLDLFVFEEVLRFGERMLKTAKRPVRLAFNVSRAHLASDEPMEPYIRLWRQHSVPSALLEFEFTESVIYDNPQKLRTICDLLHSHGFRCAMDDFGSGYSSLNMLHESRVDMLKLDRYFLGRDARIGERSKTIIAAVIDLAHKLNMETLAEGVEYAEQSKFLTECGCDYIQGYYRSKPVPVKEAEKIYEEAQK